MPQALAEATRQFSKIDVREREDLMKFEELGLTEITLRAVRSEGYSTATPIQIQAIPPILKGQDLMGCAQTGTGKTAAFALPTLERLALSRAQPPVAGARPQVNGNRKIRALVLSPTRELAAQICDSFAAYGRFAGMRHDVIYGGVGQHSQVRALRSGLDILVATPGRLLDLMAQGYVDLSHVEILILDESDQMLDLGFIHPLRRIVSQVPRKRQTLMFSATMPSEIRKLAMEWLREPIHIQVAPVATPADRISQVVYHIEPDSKPNLLAHVLRDSAHVRTLVFTRTKRGADRATRYLNNSGIPADSIHGDKSQSARQRALEQFKSDRPLVLVATDIAARGLDVDAISHVVNYDLPNTPEIYVHRIGRTARAGAEGIAISFCTSEERAQLRDIERLIRQSIAVAKLPHDLPAPVRKTPMHTPAAHKSPAQSGSAHHGSAHKSKDQYPAHGARSQSGGQQRAPSRGFSASSKRPAKQKRHPSGPGRFART